YSSHHVLFLLTILQTVTLSRVSSAELMEVGVERKHLYLVDANIRKLTKELTTDAEAQIADLKSRIKEIYGCVNMDVCASTGARMILDAILLALRKVASTQQRDVAIIPVTKTCQDDDVILISHPVSGYQLRLSDKVDYVVIDHDDEPELEHIRESEHQTSSLHKSLHDLLSLLGLTDAPHFVDCMPEAIRQAIVLLKSAKLPEVRFCLSDGDWWKFFILKSEGDTITYYDSAVRCLRRDDDIGHIPLAELVLLLREWVSFFPAC
ncbi:hypothetical protein V8E53_011896, partial [Lactarius tabidus]